MTKIKLLSMLTLLTLIACGGESPAGSSPTKYYLAKNVKFKSSAAETLIPSAMADTVEVDTTTTISADQVLLDNSDIGIDATNVQDAFGETEPDLNTTIIGAWTLTLIDYTMCSELMGSSTFTCNLGQITFKDDGTFTIDSFTYGYGILGLMPVFGTEGESVITQTSFQILENSVLAVSVSTSDSEDGESSSTNRKAFAIAKMTPTKIVTANFILTKIE